MEENHLYVQIAETIRSQILEGELKPGDRLLSIRAMMKKWNCTPGTIQRAYRTLSQQGLIISRPGKGTHVIDRLPSFENAHIRKASVINRADSFLLETITAGYSLEEVKDALQIAFDRWQTMTVIKDKEQSKEIRLSGSHDLALKWLCDHFQEIQPGYTIKPEYSGSLGGLISLSQGQADLAASHLWDPGAETYNDAFIRRIFPGKKMAAMTLAERSLGFMVLPGNPKGITKLDSLALPGIVFVNRQPGSGTRVWLDIQLKKLEIEPNTISGYQKEYNTHSSVAQAVANGTADVGIGLEAVSHLFDLDFIPLIKEQFDLIMFADRIKTSPFQEMQQFLMQPETRLALTNLVGYDCARSGDLRIIE